MITGESYTVHIGNNLDILPTLADNSVDSIVTDPPYELGFMGKKWDNSGIAYSVELWTECLRVLKPGGHLLSFGGTRTWHRVAVGIEDAGFEVRDSIAWMYGSGFPKSLDVSKAIDKTDAAEARRKRDLEFTAWMRSAGITATQINDLTQSAMASHYLTDKQQPAVATEEMFSKLRSYLPVVPDYIEKMVAERTIESQNFKNREVVGEGKSGKTAIWNEQGQMGEFDITAPSTPEAQQWEGWGTALKPAFEPIVVARKPLIGTVAANVLEHGTGALNIDGSRIASTDSLFRKSSLALPENQRIHDGYQRPWKQDAQKVAEANERTQEKSALADRLGRWPANVILDEYSAELLDEQSGVSVSKSGGKSSSSNSGSMAGGILGETQRGGHNDTGGASRFFYVAKASKRDRNEGLEELPTKQVGTYAQDEWSRQNMGNTPDSSRNGVANFHPTVKPTQLMRYLVKLVTPPGGTVLDPFTGSGSTGKAAILEGFTFIGCELTEDYIPIIEGRLKHAELMKAEAEVKQKEALF
jgi:site-specific DNA-methyltransferase (adenine-specific)